MKDTITTVYCLCDDFLKAMDYQEAPMAARFMSPGTVAAFPAPNRGIR